MSFRAFWTLNTTIDDPGFMPVNFENQVNIREVRAETNLHLQMHVTECREFWIGYADELDLKLLC